AARAIDAERARTKRAAGAVKISEQEIGSVDQHMSATLGGDRETEQHRLGERVFDRFALGRVATRRSKRRVRLDHQDLRSDPLEADDAAAAFLAAIEADIVRSQPGRESGRVQNVGVEAWDFEEQRAGPLLPVERKVAIEF